MRIRFASTCIGLVEENSGINVLEVGVERVNRAGSHTRNHNLVLDRLGVELLASLRELKEVNLEGLGWRVGNLVCQETAFCAV